MSFVYKSISSNSLILFYYFYVITDVSVSTHVDHIDVVAEPKPAEEDLGVKIEEGKLFFILYHCTTSLQYRHLRRPTRVILDGYTVNFDRTSFLSITTCNNFVILLWNFHILLQTLV